MKSYFKLIFSSLFILALMISCETEETTVVDAESAVQKEVDQARYIYYSPWEYVMDWRFSRGSCASGPGICFKNDDGDIWDYGLSQGDPNDYFDEVNYHMNKLMQGNTDPDSGVMVFRLEGEVLHMVFSRDLEEGNLVIDRDQALRADLSAALGAEGITIPEGEYEVDRSRFEHGEAFIQLR